jgi:[acyl-carrier-protein] S-malonyltransferase
MKYQKPVVVFPGQGSQSAGMGEQLYNSFPVAKKAFDDASNVLGYNVAELCFSNPSNKLSDTEFCQPAIFVVSYAAHKALEERCAQEGVSLKPHLMAGHSLGEYTAAAVSGALSFEDAVGLVQKRGRSMRANGHRGREKAVAVILEEKDYQGELENVAAKHGVYVMNLNNRRQTVVGGYNEGMDAFAVEVLKQGIARNVIPLDISRAFHTPLMQESADELKPYIDGLNMQNPSVPIISNVTGLPVADALGLKDELYRQIFNRVNWVGVADYALNEGSDLFIEVGPGRVLYGLIGHIAKDAGKTVQIHHVGDVHTLDRIMAVLSKGHEAD